MTKKFFLIIILSFVLILSFVFLAQTGRSFTPPTAVWISEDHRIVIFNDRQYQSPFGHFGSLGYIVDDNGEQIYFFAQFFNGSFRLHDVQKFFEQTNEFFMYGYWRHTRRQVLFDVDGETIHFTRTTKYDSLNTFNWNPGIENLYGVWETADGMLRLYLDEVLLVRTERGIASLFLRNPRFMGVYDPCGANLGLLISGSFTPYTERFGIVISENGNLRGHSFAPIDGGRFMRASGILEGDEIRLNLASDRFTTISGDWYFPREIIMYRISN